MKNGIHIHIPPFALRLSTAALAAAAVAVLAVQSPDIWRYIKIKTM